MIDALPKALGVPVSKIPFNRLKYLIFYWLYCPVAVFSVGNVG